MMLSFAQIAELESLLAKKADAARDLARAIQARLDLNAQIVTLHRQALAAGEQVNTVEAEIHGFLIDAVEGLPT